MRTVWDKSSERPRLLSLGSVKWPEITRKTFRWVGNPSEKGTGHLYDHD